MRPIVSPTSATAFGSAFNTPQFLIHLKIVGLALIAVSILYLIAANWFMLPKTVQLAIPQVILLGSASASLFARQHDSLIQTLHTIVGVMIGLSLAVIGQVYQTGADSYLLFFLWSLLLLPWFYRPNIGIFVLFSIVSFLALILALQQTILSQYLYLDFSLTTLWMLFLFGLALRYYPALRFLFLAYFSIHSICVIIAYFNMDDPVLLLICFVTLALIFFYFHSKKDHLSLTLTALIFGSCITLLILRSLQSNMQDTFNTLFISAILIFAWFAGISATLNRLFPNNKFSFIPLAFGAWLAGLFFAALILIFWGNLSLIAGVFFIVIGSVILNHQHASLFVRQLAYCLFISGQIAFLAHLSIELEQIWPAFLLQILLCIGLFLFRTHWIFWMVQLLALYLLGMATIIFNAEFSTLDAFKSNQYWLIYLLNYGFFSLIFALPYIRQDYHRSILMVVLASLVIHAFSSPLFNLFPQHALQSFSAWVNIFPILFFLIFAFLYLKQQLIPLILIIFSVFAAALIYLGYFEIFIIIIILAWSIQYKDGLIHALSLICLSALLFYLYYSLDISFLQKSLSIFASGLILLGLCYLLTQSQKSQEISA